MRRKTWLSACLAVAVLAVSCGSGSPEPPPAVAPFEVPPAPVPARVSVPPQPGVEVPSTEAPPASAAGTSTTTLTTMTASTVTTPVTTAVTATTSTSTPTPPTTTTAVVPPVTVTSVPEAPVSLDGGALVPGVYTTPPPLLPVPVLPVSASEIPVENRAYLSAGLNYSCALYGRDDAVECWYWGEPFRPPKDFSADPSWDEVYDGWGEPSVEVPEGGFVVVDAGREAACGIRPTGGLECWGASPLASVPPPAGEFVSVSVGIEHACALRPSGQAECWGTSARLAGAMFPPSGEFTSISANEYSVCGLRPSGEVECWGAGYKSSGRGDTLSPSGVFKAVSVGGRGDVCGLRLDNSVECWGNYDLGNDQNLESTYLLPLGGEFESVSVGGDDYACGLRSSGEVECWSRIFRGRMKPANGPPEGEKFTRVEVLWVDACGVRVDNTLLCWSRYLELNDIVAARVVAFHEKLNTLENVLQLEIGMGDVCALLVGGTVQCLFDLLKETEALSGVFTSVSVGDDHACGLRSSGVVECWGSDEHGKSSPPGGEFTELAATANFTCGLRVSGEVECWGGDKDGREWRHSKVVAPREPLVFIDAGWGGHNHPWPFQKQSGTSAIIIPSPSSVDWGYSCGLREDGSLFCWGNDESYLDDEDIRTYDSLRYGDGPILSPPEGVFVDVGVGRFQACALSVIGEVKCWGIYGDYTYGEKTGGKRYNFLEVGGWHACGNIGRIVECWNLQTQEPVLPSPLNLRGYPRAGGYTYISSGYFHVCGYNDRRRGVTCWGPAMTRYLR